MEGSEIICAAAVAGDIVTLKQELFKFPANLRRAASAASAAGKLDVLKWLHETSFCVSRSQPSILTAAALNGHFHVIDWGLHVGIKPSPDLMSALIRGRHWEYFKKCIDRGCPVDASVMHTAVLSGNLTVLYWLMLRSTKIPIQPTTCAAAREHGLWKMLTKIEIYGCECKGMLH